MKKILLPALLITSLFSTGCATLDKIQDEYAYKRGTNVTQEQIDNFKVSKTKKTEIIKSLGEPQREKGNIIEYHYQQINHLTGGVDQTIRFVFSKKGLLVDIKKIKGSQFGNALTDG